jgi:hypothetical protein
LARKDTQPSSGNFVVGPLRNHIRAIAQNDMQVIGENRIGEDVDPEDGGKAFHTGPNPFSARRVISTCERIISSEKGTTNTTLNAVNDADFVGIEQFSTQWSWHDKSPN